MHYNKGCVIFFVIIVNAVHIYGILEINLPPDNIGNYGESTQMNCTDNTFNIANGYNWYKDNVIIYNSANGDTAKYKSSHGADYFTLEITNTLLTDNGVYRCNYNFQDKSDTLEIQATGKGAGKVDNGKLEITFTGLYPVTTTVSSVTCNGKTITGSTTSTITDSFLTLVWISSTNVDSSDLKAGCDASISSRTAYSIQVTVGEATTTTSTTSTTTPVSTTTTKPDTTTTTTPTTTTTTTPTTTTSSLTTTTTPVTSPSTTSLSDEMIIVIVVVSVGVIAIVGTVIFFCLFYRLRRGGRKPTSHKRHKQVKHYKDDMRPVQQHQQQPYILYDRGHTRQSNHKETKRSRSIHKDDRYNLYDGYHWGSRAKQNPVYKGDRNLGRLYYKESLPRNDDYRSEYTRGHVYPSHTSDYHYRQDYHGDSRRHGTRQYSSYPIYSRQQEYIDPSYSYMGY